MVKKNGKQARVFIDCDSTLSSIEGIDELARYAGCHSYVSELTRAGMAGELELAEVYALRLNAVRPNLKMISKLAKLYLARMTPGADQAMARLTELGYEPAVISAGPRQAILPFAVSLGLSVEQVHAVELVFNDESEYMNFDESSPLVHHDGKAKLCSKLLPKDSTGVMVGDGYNDALASEAKLLFVQFAGVCDRSQVAKHADARIESNSLSELPQVIEELLA